eukprot:5389341-Pyramimonas_sp.AAC.1
MKTGKRRPLSCSLPPTLLREAPSRSSWRWTRTTCWKLGVSMRRDGPKKGAIHVAMLQALLRNQTIEKSGNMIDE